MYVALIFQSHKNKFKSCYTFHDEKIVDFYLKLSLNCIRTEWEITKVRTTECLYWALYYSKVICQLAPSQCGALFIDSVYLDIYMYISTHVFFIHHSSSIVLHQSPITLSIGWLRTWHTSMYKSSTCPPRRSRLPGAESQPSSSNGQDDFESKPVPRRKTCWVESRENGFAGSSSVWA